VAPHSHFFIFNPILDKEELCFDILGLLSTEKIPFLVVAKDGLSQFWGYANHKRSIDKEIICKITDVIHSNCFIHTLMMCIIIILREQAPQVFEYLHSP
jgi:hypothetical protein